MPQSATAGSLVRSHFEPDLPPPMRFLLAATIISSSIVMLEPAPCDLLFVTLLPFAFWYGYSIIPRRMPFLFYLASYVFVFLNLVSLIFVDDIVRGIVFAGTTFYLFVYFFLLADIVGRHGRAAVDLMLKAFVIAAVVAAVIGILAHYHWIPLAEVFFRDEHGLRIRSTFKDPNVFAPFLVAATLITLGKVLEAARVTVAQFLVLGLLLVGILLAFSRGAYIHLLVSLACFGIVHLLIIRERQAVLRLFSSGAFLLVVGLPLLLWFLISSGLVDFFFKRMSLEAYDRGRFSTQAIALSVGMDWPLGIGPGQFIGSRFGLAAHSLYMRVFVENGLFGLISLFVFLAYWIFLCLKQILDRGSYAGLYLVCFSVLIGILVESVVIDTLHWRHMFFFLAIPVGLSMYDRE